MTTSRPLAHLPRLLFRQSINPHKTTRHTIRSISTTAIRQSSTDENPHSQKAAQEDRKKMSVEPNEYSKSMTDSDAAKQDEAAYDTNNSDPQQAKKKAGEGKEVNPLDASPANPEISQHTGEAAGGAGKKIEGKGGASGGSTAGRGNQ